MFHKKNVKVDFGKENKKAVLRCSICTGEQVAGFKDLTRKFEDVMLIKCDKDLEVL